ncbi:glycosyltransferase family 2 protein [Rhizobium sp. L80/93]|uniref:glycosyltransferase family 2 protein n=1 Tax=Rhizobium sp. E27B/91 TaxID=2819995 RepID=UPI001ADCDED4|nr:glycosyltransferase family 2 protein [Rhizobium sp. E27B/91]
MTLQSNDSHNGKVDVSLHSVALPRMRYSKDVAKAIAIDIGSGSVLLIGLGRGLLVQELKKLGIQVFAIDIGSHDAHDTSDLTVSNKTLDTSIETATAIEAISSLSDKILVCWDGECVGCLKQTSHPSLIHLLSEFASRGFVPQQSYTPDFTVGSLALLERRQDVITENQQFGFADLLAERIQACFHLRDINKEHNASLHALKTEYENRIVDAERQLSQSLEMQEQIRASVKELQNSTSWRVTAPYRYLGAQIVHIRKFLRIARILAKSRGGYSGLIKAAVSIISKDGLRGVISAWRSANITSISGNGSGSNYSKWLETYGILGDEARQTIRYEIGQWRNPPLISIIMPVYNPELSWLEEAIESVRGQLYTNWELCIADDGSTTEGVKDVLEAYHARDKRIKVTYRTVNGHISEASNSALALATGEWMTLLDQDDLLTEDALYHVSRTLIANPGLDLVYSDEDKIEDGRRFDPYFKPDWNVELLRSHNMVCHLSTFRIERVRAIGAFRRGFEGSQDYDLVLRFSEGLDPDRIAHIPRVLYHWRVHSNSTAQESGNKSYAAVAGRKALAEHLERLGIDATVEILDTGMCRTRYGLPQQLPLASLIIPTRNGLDLVRQCVTSILQATSYPAYEIIIVDNNSDDPATLAYFRDIATNPRIRVERDDRPFNYSALNNRAVEMSNGDYVVLINNDIEVISPDWLSEMMSLAMQDGVGAVGARLWYPDETLQHGGVIIGLGGVAGHSHKQLKRGLPGYFRRAELPQDLSAVTAACLVIRKSTFEEVGGLNEVDLKIAFNDVDFCLKVKEAGYRNVWTPYADLYHHESATRGLDDTPEKVERFRQEIAYMHARWETHRRPDPAYSPNLTLNYEDFSLAWPPRNNEGPTVAS